MISDDLDALTPGPVETIAFWLCVCTMVMLAVGSISFATGLLWDGYIHPAIVTMLMWWAGVRP